MPSRSRGSSIGFDISPRRSRSLPTTTGLKIRPGVSTLKRALGVEDRAVHEGLQMLIECGVLERDGH
jgi:hypothetical protein